MARHFREVDFERFAGQATALRDAWRASGEIRHVTLTDLLRPERQEPLSDFQGVSHMHAGSIRQNHKHVCGKTGSNKEEVMNEAQRRFYDEVHSPEFVEQLKFITGIDDLHVDPEKHGGGLHEITAGGFLHVHTDFNYQPTTKKHRRLNLLVYLTTPWDDAWGGNIELWDVDIRRPFLSLRPEFGNVLIFETSERSYHGHPEPLRTPLGVSRKSLATYYFSSFPPDVKPRKETGYQLTRSQWAEMIGQLAPLMAQGLGESEILLQLYPFHQYKDLRAGLAALRRLEARHDVGVDAWPGAMTELARRIAAGASPEEAAAEVRSLPSEATTDALKELLALRSATLRPEPYVHVKGDSTRKADYGACDSFRHNFDVFTLDGETLHMRGWAYVTDHAPLRLCVEAADGEVQRLAFDQQRPDVVRKRGLPDGLPPVGFDVRVGVTQGKGRVGFEVGKTIVWVRDVP